MVGYLTMGMVIFGAVAVMPSLASAQSSTTTKATSASTDAAEDPNDQTEHERTFEETRKHMQLHREWSKKTGKMNDRDRLIYKALFNVIRDGAGPTPSLYLTRNRSFFDIEPSRRKTIADLTLPSLRRIVPRGSTFRKRRETVVLAVQE